MDDRSPARTFSITNPISRREAMAAAVTGIGVAAFGTASIRAQGATPVATPATMEEEAAFLFVQSGFSTGSFELNDGETYLLTLKNAPEQTIFFSDRPQRIVGTTQTAQFLAELGFDPADPPNAALVIAQNDGTTDTMVLELLDPAYDKASATLTYQVKVLEGYDTTQATEAGFMEQPLTADEVPATFGQCSLFIDSMPGCSPWDPRC